ncbi:hypothetical protein [Dehalogenimonas alkenigignens]|uniref:Uncharacterized protein n=1 Tax=Dehalogenimonas alkenigignens TaxID=1217799 RepID=A0A0W0GGC9_9CHLR|nr:hypothetical protein [Dehalogenimonas alkenigignens]KTB47618.1 hypothetical protein DEALK_04630 [Dehalogenimonas alkenigignens]PVV82842.1 hypothetical protein DD509_07555 [Dehalogenimonas alkenigignens]
MARNVGIAVMLLTAAAILVTSLVSWNWLAGIAGGAFLLTGLASWKWQAGINYAFGVGIILLLSSIPFLFSSESPWYYGTLGTLSSAVFIIGALITFRFDQKNNQVRGMSP